MNSHRYFHFLFLMVFCIFISVGMVFAAVPVSSTIKLTADDDAYEGSMFGWSVAIDGDTAVVSSPGDLNGIGAAYVYERSGSGWNRVVRLAAPDGRRGDMLGLSVTINGDTVVLGTALDDNGECGENKECVDAGAIYVYVKPASGWAAAESIEPEKITIPGNRSNRGFGSAIALQDGFLVVSAMGKPDATISGEVFVFEGTGSNRVLAATLSVDGLVGDDSFGFALDIDGDTIVVSSFGADKKRGKVYVYSKPAEGWNDNSPYTELTADDGVASDFFGGSVAIDGNSILVGANGVDDNDRNFTKSGAAYLFVNSGGSWVQQKKLTPSSGGMTEGNFGYVVDLAGDAAVIGASRISLDPSDTVSASDTVYLFTRSGNNWTEQGELGDPDEKDKSRFGSSVAIDSSATTILAGALEADAGTEQNAGAAYLFELDSPVNLALVKQDDIDPVLVGRNVTYNLVVTNNSKTDATGVKVIDTLPAGLSYVSDDGSCSRNGQTVSCDLGTVGKNGGTASVAISARADSAGNVTNTATVSANETDAEHADNTDSENTVVIKENTPPQAVGDMVATDEDTAVTTSNVLANDTDADSDPLSISGADTKSSRGGKVVEKSDGIFIYTPPVDFNGTDSFNYTVSDDNGGEDQGTVQITVNAVNDPPVAVDDNVTTDEGTVVKTRNVLANDTDPDKGDTLSISEPVSKSLEGGRVEYNDNGMFTYTPPAGFSGDDSFNYTVIDGSGGEDSGTVNVKVIKVVVVNNPPVAMEDFATTQQDSPVTTGNVLDNDTDADKDTLTVISADGESARGGKVLNHDDGTFTYTPSSGYFGDDSFKYVVSDGRGGKATGVVTITVEKLAVSDNNAPVAADDTAETEVDTAITIADVLANDIDDDGDSLGIIGTYEQSREGGKVDYSNGVFTYTPPKGFDGEDSFSYTVNDGNGGEDQGTVVITVKKTDDGDGLPPVGAFGMWMLLLLLFPLGYRRYQSGGRH